MTDGLRDRLTDYLTRIESYPLGPVDGELTICAESMADALLPFIRAEIARELRGYVAGMDPGSRPPDDRPLEVVAWKGDQHWRKFLRNRADELDPEGSTR